MSAVLQILSFMVDCQMTVHDAMRQPRIDVSGGTDITIDTLLDPDIVEYLSRHHSVIAVPHGVYPSMYACPGIAQFDPQRSSLLGGLRQVQHHAHRVQAAVMVPKSTICNRL